MLFTNSGAISVFYFGFYNNCDIGDICQCSYLSVCCIGDIGYCFAYWFARYDAKYDIWRIFTIYIDWDIGYSFYQVDL